ncbi:MAG: MMPL family transporter [Xanthomonadaceae bacterium]|nr:MMPL family transporter [Xanthomonadaceae bacterium]
MKLLPARTRLALALAWLGLLAVIGFWLSSQLSMSGDLRKFMPAPQTPEQRLLMDELGEGPGSRLLLLSISGADADTLAAQSRALAAMLAADDRFLLVSNGEAAGIDAIPERLRPYRYLLTSSFDARPLDRDYLATELQARIEDLGSPAAGLLEPLIPADPTLETLKLLESWQPVNGPQRLHDVWFDRTGTSALLVTETRAAGFDPTGQETAVNAVRAAFAKASTGTKTSLEMSGPGSISVEIGGRTAREAGLIGSVDTIGLILLLLIAYRSWKMPLFGVLPLATAGIAGLVAVALLFDGVHGITIAFGFTLIGVVQDYPIHLFSHQRAGITPWQNARSIWPTLATGVAATCIAYFTFLASGVDGLKQLAVFTIAALLAAALATRFLLPALLDPDPRDPADSPLMAWLWRGIERVPRPRAWMLALLAVVALGVVKFSPPPFWQNDLSKLTPVPADTMARDIRLREELGAPDVRYLLAVHGRDVETVLQASEALRPKLDAMQARGVIGGYDMAARYLPSIRTQRARQAALPQAGVLQTELDAALADTDFVPDAFADFVRDVASARDAPPLTARDLAGTPLTTTLAGLLREQDDRATALVSVSGIRDDGAFLLAAKNAGLQPVDMKQASESLVAQYRQRVLWSLLVAALLLSATVWFSLRDPRRTLRVLLPMALTTLVILAVLRAFGVELNLFHLVALILAAGLGLDYALFFDHAGDGMRDQLRTLHALIVCSLMTLLVFALLGLSSIPVLRAIGTTVTLGVVSNFVLGLLIARQPATRTETTHA